MRDEGFEANLSFKDCNIRTMTGRVRSNRNRGCQGGQREQDEISGGELRERRNIAWVNLSAAN